MHGSSLARLQERGALTGSSCRKGAPGSSTASRASPAGGDCKFGLGRGALEGTKPGISCHRGASSAGLKLPPPTLWRLFRGPAAHPHVVCCPIPPGFQTRVQTGSRRSHLSRRTRLGLATPGSGPEWARQQRDGAAHADRAHQGWPAPGGGPGRGEGARHVRLQVAGQGAPGGAALRRAWWHWRRGGSGSSGRSDGQS